MQRFQGGLVFKAHRLGSSLNSRLESNKDEERSIAGSSGWDACPPASGVQLIEAFEVVWERSCLDTKKINPLLKKKNFIQNHKGLKIVELKLGVSGFRFRVLGVGFGGLGSGFRIFEPRRFSRRVSEERRTYH